MGEGNAYSLAIRMVIGTPVSPAAFCHFLMDAAGEPCNHVVSSQKVLKESERFAGDTGLPAIRMGTYLPRYTRVAVVYSDFKQRRYNFGYKL